MGSGVVWTVGVAMLTLTDAEVDAAIESAYMATQQTNIVDGIRPPFIVGKELWRVIYRAGIAAGIERSAKVCEIRGDTTATYFASVIRALLK